MEISKELDYGTMMNKLTVLARENEMLKLSYIGNSILSRPIPVITVGDFKAQKSVLYVATHHATENICTSVLVKFLNELSESSKRHENCCGINLDFLFKTRKIYVIPMLNPDGVEYRLNGTDEMNPLYDRVMKYSNGGDFSKWNANARGVDLNHNYDAYFNEYKKHESELGILPGNGKYSGEAPESEPETSALASFIRYNTDELCGVLTLHSQGEEIYYKSRGMCPKKSEFLAGMIGRMTGYKPSEAQGMSSCGGLTDWFIKEIGKPSFTIECGMGENPLPMSQLTRIYLSLRELLFTFPILF